MFAYIIFSETRSRYYVGQTSNVNKRLKRHNKGIIASTKGGAPWKLILQIEISNRSEAMLLEKKIKKRGAKRFIDDHFGV
jgi:putative endonuclease